MTSTAADAARPRARARATGVLASGILGAGMSRLDRALGRTSMYGVLVGVLSTLALWALLGSLVGGLPQSPLDLATSLVLCVGASVISNRVCAAVAHAPTRHASALATGLLLFFLLWPAATATDMLAATLAAVLANASKYLLVARGRRLVNPAAFGAVVVAVAGIGAPVWWVANSWMLPLVLVGGLVVLRRAGGTEIALVVGAIALIGTVLRLALTGTAPLDAFPTAVVSYPVVFLALFMATEPLTLPPLRRQRMMVAALMGVLVCLPVTAHLGAWAFTLGPEAAIVGANLVSWALAGRGAAGALEIVEIHRPTPTIAEVVLAPGRPLNFHAGQYVELTVGTGMAIAGNRRVFSLVSAPQEASGERPRLRVAFRVPPHPSAFKTQLLSLSGGAVVRGEGIRGEFLLPEDSSVPVLMVARGIGVTPFLSQLRDLDARGEERDVVLLYVVRDPADAALVEGMGGPGVRVVVISDEGGRSGERRNGVLDPARHCPDLTSRQAFVSGAPDFVRRTRSDLAQAGVVSVRTDTFSGY